MFLTPQEIALMRSDFERLLRSSEAQLITIEYRTWYAPGQPTMVDPVYGKDERRIHPNAVRREDVRCIQKIIKMNWELKKFPEFLIEVGDAVFYFSTTLNLVEPVLGSPVVPKTLTFVDQSGIRWKPKQEVGVPATKNVLMRLGEFPFSQPVGCSLER